MKLRSLEARVFGPLRHERFDLDGDVVLIHGPNESGKSSFAAAVETLLYGFEPASREHHALYAWDPSGGDLELACEIELDDGTRLAVDRALRSTGRLRVATNGEPARRLGNRPLEACGLPRELFRAVYALETRQLEALEGKVRAHVDELLLPRSDALDLRPAVEVREQLARDHTALWRPDRRGKPKAQRLRDDLAKAREGLRAAAADERALRGARAERVSLEVSLAGLLERRRELELLRDDAPFLRECLELSARRRALGPRVDLSALGELVLLEPTLLAREIEELELALDAPAARLASPPAVLQDWARALLDAESEIEAALDAAPRHAAERERLDELLERSAALRARALAELGSALAAPPCDEHLEAVAAIPVEALRAAAQAWAVAREAASQRRGREAVPAVWLGVAALGAALAGLVALFDLPATLALLGSAAALGALVVARLGRPAEEERTPPPGLDGALASLASLPVAAALLASPAEVMRLLDVLARVRQTAHDAGEARRRGATLGALVAGRSGQARALAERLGFELTAEAGGVDGEPSARLRQALAQACDERRRVERDTREREHAAKELATHRPALDRKRQHLECLERALRANAPEATDLESAYREVRARLHEERFVAERERELSRDSRFGRVDARLCAGDELAEVSPEAVSARESELLEIDQAIGRAQKRLGELSSRLRDDPGSQQAKARDEVLALEQGLAALEGERDRLALAEAIWARAEREFRDAHQPDVLRRASHYLARVTDGRYTRLDVSDEGEVFVTCSGRPEPLPVGRPLSRGTLDQIYLALRLGLLDHLDQGRERLPLLLDDALVRSDPERRREIYALLTEAARTRQVFLLTCHPALADEAERALGPRRIELTG